MSNRLKATWKLFFLLQWPYTIQLCFEPFQVSEHFKRLLVNFTLLNQFFENYLFIYLVKRSVGVNQTKSRRNSTGISNNICPTIIHPHTHTRYISPVLWWKCIRLHVHVCVCATFTWKLWKQYSWVVPCADWCLKAKKKKLLIVRVIFGRISVR